MSSPSNTPVSSIAASIDSESSISQVGEPWLPEPEELPTTPWYEEKASTLRISDIPIIKEEGGTMGKFEVVIPHPDERAHRPPPGFHTFYMNQIEMGLRFPIPRFIAAFCRHIQLSPSQLAPNSYSFLLALAVLLSYHELPLIPYVLMQLVQIKRLGPGKFYLSHKEDHTFNKGNPSSHKGWMSRFFYIKCDIMRDPWRCEMHWRDSAVTLVPRTPDRAPSLTPFLEAINGKSYNAPELIKEDLLCLYKFSRKGVELFGNLDERMGKAELLRAMQEAAVASPKKSTKRKAPSMVEKEARGEKRKKAGASTSGARTKETSKQKQAPTPPTPSSEEPLDSPSAIAAIRYICNMAPDRDRRALRKARNADVVGHFSTNLAAAVAWGGELVKRLTQTYQKLNASREQFDRAMGQHTKMLARLEELEAHRAREEGEAKAQRKALEAQLAAEKEAHEAEKAARALLEAELEEVKARAGQEAERLKIESREEFLKSPEFDTLLGKKAGGYFKNGFRGCLAQWRANGYSEEEHPASFLDVQQAIIEMADEEEEGEEEEKEEGDEDYANGQCGTGLMCRTGRAYVCVEELREWPVRNWAYVPNSWSGLYVCVEELREFASAELCLCAELVGLIRLRRRATRVCQCGTVVRNWALLLRWGCHPRSCQCRTGLMCRAGRAYVFA
ncbi:hypothetical protein F511_18588 [Dorcoceras hygrometricum]|uniref:Transposase (Putative), gypsy type n=1 Tax=Dorcoceras hygrometricum TaxID=472368 RepID=A0A2Z7DHR6_9LAMI|nr:hypothetical protein F511_18588 [Dorcoceras hygrometricum]